MYELENYIKYPTECRVDNKITKKQIYETAELKTKDQQTFKDVEKINWIYSLKKNNTNIDSYSDKEVEYSEVEIIEIIMRKKNEKNIDRIADIIHRTIPYPTLLIFHYYEQVRLCVAHQREHKSDYSKITLTDLRITKWINLIDLDVLDEKLFENLKLENLNHTNFYKLYESIVNSIIIYNGSKEVGKEIKIPAEEIRQINNQIYEIDKKIRKYKAELNKETQFNKKVDINMEISKLHQQKIKLIESLKGEYLWKKQH